MLKQRVAYNSDLLNLLRVIQVKTALQVLALRNSDESHPV